MLRVAFGCLLVIAPDCIAQAVGPRVSIEAGDIVLDVPVGKSVKYRVSGGAAKVIATADDVTAAVESLTARLSQSESRAAVADANCSRQVAELTGDIAALQSQYQYLYAYTRSEPPTQAPTVSPTNVAATCADLPRGSPSGTYDLAGVSGIPRVYCNMEMAGGNWNLCAHAGATLVSGGSRHWHGSFNAAAVNFTASRSEAAWCGRAGRISEILVQQTSSDLSTDSAITVNWYNLTADVNPGTRGWPINRDVTSVSTNRAGFLTTDQVWSNSNEAFTEHFYFTFSELNRAGSNHVNGRVQYYEIGGHRNGRHQHYEENCCGGGSTGNGMIGAGTFRSHGGGCDRHTCGPDKHVFFYYR